MVLSTIRRLERWPLGLELGCTLDNHWTMSNPFQWTNVSLSVLLLAQSHTLNQTDICKKLCQRLNFISKELISKAEGRLVVLVYPCDR